jgi:hypothetical protein
MSTFRYGLLLGAAMMLSGNAFVVLLCSFFESQRVQSLLGTTVTRRGTIVAKLIRGYFNIDAAAIRVPVKTVLISLAGLQLVSTEQTSQACCYS